jgi:hypothetical protein
MPAYRTGTLTSNQFGPRSRRSKWRPLFAGLCALAFCSSIGGVAFAEDCSTEIGTLSKRRQAIIDDLNRLAKTSPKGQLDPTASCPKLRTLAAAEQQLLAYLTKNKEWCMVPDDAVANFMAASEKSKTIAAKACAVAEQIKKGLQAGGAAAQGPKLPTGPL